MLIKRGTYVWSYKCLIVYRVFPIKQAEQILTNYLNVKLEHYTLSCNWMIYSNNLIAKIKLFYTRNTVRLLRLH